MFFQKLNSTSTDISSGTSNLVVETAISSAPGDLLKVERLEVNHSYSLISLSFSCHIFLFLAEIETWVAFAVRGKMNDKDLILIEVF